MVCWYRVEGIEKENKMGGKRQTDTEAFKYAAGKDKNPDICACCQEQIDGEIVYDIEKHKVYHSYCWKNLQALRAEGIDI